MANTAIEYINVNATSATGRDDSEFIESVIRNRLSERRVGMGVARGEDSSSNSSRFNGDDGASIREEDEPRLVVPVLAPAKEAPRSVLIPLQEWEGYVTAVRDDGFSAYLVDLTAGDELPSEEADISLDEVSDPDRRLLREGAVFRWTIGYEKSIGGTKKRISQIVFRRLPQWTKKEIKSADQAAKELLAGITWE